MGDFNFAPSVVKMQRSAKDFRGLHGFFRAGEVKETNSST
jgi:hypothetical protein